MDASYNTMVCLPRGRLGDCLVLRAVRMMRVPTLHYVTLTFPLYLVYLTITARHSAATKLQRTHNTHARTPFAVFFFPVLF